MLVGFVLLQKVAEDGLGTELEATENLSLLKDNLDYFLEERFLVFVWHFKGAQELVLVGEDLQETLDNAVMEQL